MTPAAVDRFADVLGRDAVLEMLVTAEKGSKFEALYTEMQRYGGDRVSIATLCMRLGISWTALVEFHRNYNVQRGLLRAATHAPQVIEDLAGDAKSRSLGCKRCDGVGLLPDVVKDEQDGKLKSKPCPDCEGSGRVRTPGDHGSRTLLFEMLGLTNKKGPLLAQQFNFNSTGGTEPLASVVGAIPKLIEVKNVP